MLHTFRNYEKSTTGHSLGKRSKWEGESIHKGFQLYLMLYFFKIYDASKSECKDLSLTGCWLRGISYGSYINKCYLFIVYFTCLVLYKSSKLCKKFRYTRR